MYKLINKLDNSVALTSAQMRWTMNGQLESENSVYGCFNESDYDIVEFTPLEPITMRQARLALLELGLLDDVELAISGLDRAAQIEWEFAVEVKRDYPLVLQLATALNMTESDMDAFFESAKLI